MYVTNYTYVSIRAVYQMPHTEPLTVEPLTRPVESTLGGNNCIAVFVMNQAEDRWMLPVGFKLLDVRQK